MLFVEGDHANKGNPTNREMDQGVGGHGGVDYDRTLGRRVLFSSWGFALL
jgi:hypothetical protein